MALLIVIGFGGLPAADIMPTLRISTIIRKKCFLRENLDKFIVKLLV